MTTTESFLFVCLMVFNATFNNISVISWSVLLVEKTTDLSQATDKLYHIMLYTLPWLRFKLTASVVIGIDCIGCCKSNYHTIMATMAPNHWKVCAMDTVCVWGILVFDMAVIFFADRAVWYKFAI